MPAWLTPWVALSLSRHIGGKTLRALLAQFDNDPYGVLAAEEDALRDVPGVGPAIARHIQQIHLPSVAEAITRWQEAGVLILAQRDPAYPAALLELEDEPPTLFVRGDWDPARLDGAVAVVGTRDPSPEAVELATRLGAQLAESGRPVVSGLARGIDAAAHRGALAVPGAYVLAVLGSGVLNVYPPEHAPLAEAVRRGGALLCEVSPDATVSTPGLVARNRIISGLSEAVIVVETADDGGAMHAARRALAQGRAVYAVDNGASGNRALLANGAHPVAPDLEGWGL